MDKTNLTTIIIITIIIGLLSFIVWGSKTNRNGQTTQDNSKAERIVESVDLNSQTPIFFFGNTCPHCKDVEEWMKENDVEDKISIIKKEVYDNQKNAQELTEAATSCGLPTDSIGVPFLFAEGRCFIGSPDVISYLTEKAGLK